MIKITANGVCARAQRLEPLTSGMVGAKVAFALSPDFDGLTVTAVFTNGAVTKDVLNPGAECFIPPEVLEAAGKTVKVGIYAVSGSELVIPTVYANIGEVLPGADPSGDTSTSAALPVWAQIEAMIGSLDDLTTEAKNNLVAAINEAAQTGGGGASIAMRVDSGYIQYSTDEGKTWVNLIAKAELKGDTGADGKDGVDGYSPTASVTKTGKTATITITDKSGTTTATVADGQDGYTPVKGVDYFDGKDGAAGADGITPHIGYNGNWYIGSTDTGKPSRGAQGSAGAAGKDGTSATHSWNGTVLTITSASGTSSANLKGDKGDTGAAGPQGIQGIQGPQGERGPAGADGAAGPQGPKGDKGDTGAQGPKGDTGSAGAAGKDGKSAYQYAVEGGYTGTETEFAAKLAQKPLIGTTGTLTPKQVYDAVSAGIPVKVQYTDSTYGVLYFTAFNIAESLYTIVSQTIVYYDDYYILAELSGNLNGGWTFKSTMLAELTGLDSLDVRVNKLEGAGYLTLATLPKYGGEIV